MEDESSHKKHEKHEKHDKKEKHAKPKHEHKEKKMNQVTKWKIVSGVLLVLLLAVLAYNNMVPESSDASPDAVGATGADTSDDPKIELLIINDDDCSICETTEIVQAVKDNLFPTVVAKELDYKSESGAKYVEKYDIKSVPAYIFSDKVTQAANYAMIAEAMIEVNGKYMIDPATLGSGKLLNPPSTDDDDVKGDADAPVTIVEFSDFECPFCGKFFEETMPQLQSEYVDTGKVKMVFRDFPLGFHQNAQKASEASECAGDQGKYWEMHDLLFENNNALSIDDLKGYAVDLGLDPAEFDDCLDSGKHEQEVKDDMDAGKAAGVTGTPAFFINGEFLKGAQPFERFKAVIDAKLKE